MGGIQNFEFSHQNFDFAREELGVGHAFRSMIDFAPHRNHKLIAQGLRLVMHFRADGRVEYDLGQALAVTQVNENNTAMVRGAAGPIPSGRLPDRWLLR